MNQRQPAWIGLGSNLGDGKKILQHSWQRLGELPGISLDTLSSPWRSAPVEMDSANWFTNAVGRVQVEISAEELLHAMLVVEKDFGRHRDDGAKGYQDRSLDLDLLYFGRDAALERDTPFLTLPHPQISNRLFVLLPLQEIDPDLLDVATGEKIPGMIRSLQQSAAGMQQIEAEQWPIR